MEENTKLNMQMYDPESVLVPLQKLNLMDDFLFDAATVDLETCKIIIELSLGITIRNIVWKEGQKVIHNLPGNRGIRLDFYVEDDQGQVFDLFGYGLYRYTFDNRCKEVPDLVMGDECQKIHQIKMSEEIGVSYMKMEERDRLIRDEGLRRGRAEGDARLVNIIRRKASRGMEVSEIADLLEMQRAEVEAILEVFRAHPSWTDLQVAEELLCQGK